MATQIFDAIAADRGGFLPGRFLKTAGILTAGSGLRDVMAEQTETPRQQTSP